MVKKFSLSRGTENGKGFQLSYAPREENVNQWLSKCSPGMGGVCVQQNEEKN